jgi:hypothetical protein
MFHVSPRFEKVMSVAPLIEAFEVIEYAAFVVDFSLNRVTLGTGTDLARA